MRLPITYAEVVRLVRGEATQTKTARQVMRKSGFRLGSALTSPTETPVLTIPACVVVGTCPRFPYAPDLDGWTETEIEDFYAAVELAETGDAGGLTQIRDYLDELGYGIAAGSPVPLMRGGCPVEFDLEFSASPPGFEVIAVRMNGRRDPLPTGTYWHPLNVEGFVTKWDFSENSEVKTLATISAPNDATVRPVYAPTYGDLIAGDWDYLTSGVDCSSSGHFETEWESLPGGAGGDVFVAFVLEVGSTILAFSMGAAEVRTR